MGGVIASGGFVGTGGASSTPAGSGGASATGGSSGNSTVQGTGTGNGCSCRVAGTETASHPGFALFALLMFAFRLRKRR
jgi:MYXO-CTERM domain-containing protein